LGRSGLSAARWLLASGASVAVTDSRQAPPGLEALRGLGDAVVTRLGGFDFSLLDNAQQIVLSPGVSRAEPFVREALKRGLPVVGDIELFARATRVPVVAITGTNGKSTVTTLLAEMAHKANWRVRAGGNLGEPALDLLAAPEPQLYVLELSSFQLESTQSLRPIAAAVLNVSPDHMDRYADLRSYADAKAKIFENSETAIVNADDPLVCKMPVPSGRIVRFSVSGARAEYGLDEVAGVACLTCRGERLIAMSELRLPGKHNAANALAALALGDAIGLPMTDMLDTLRAFAGLPHRSQFVADIGGVRFINDSKGTNVGATLAAVTGLPGTLVIIAGGDGKGQDFAPLAQCFAGRVRHAVLIGRDRARLARTLEGVCGISYSDDMPSAVRSAAEHAVPGDLVLLSPACASLDMFRDYADRGDQFAEAVRSLAI
jgi:UDP-N-acetylmuramoylalanine--D-glutamate ligase